jgi:hypothetical protein
VSAAAPTAGKSRKMGLSGCLSKIYELSLRKIVVEPRILPLMSVKPST